MFGSLGNMANLFKTAREMQDRMTKLQQELATDRFEGDAGGGMVRATVDGRGTLTGVKIEPRATADIEMLEDLVTAAAGAAAGKAREAMKARMAAMTGGMNIPGLTDMLGGGGA